MDARLSRVRHVHENEMHRHRARFNFFSRPRTPSEDHRFRLGRIHYERRAVTYHQSKVGAIDGMPILIPREVFGLGASALTRPRRRSLRHWAADVRPKLVRRGLASGAIERDEGYVWVGAAGRRLDPDTYRQEFGAAARTEWPGFYPYLTREVAIIMRALQIAQETRGHIDIIRLAEWSGHASWDNLQKYLRKGRALLRTYKPGPDLDAPLYERSQI